MADRADVGSCFAQYPFSPQQACVKILAHSTLAPENFTTWAHFSISLRKYASNSEGFISMGSAPWTAHACCTSDRLRALPISAFSLSMISLGVPAGAMMPSQIVAA